MADYTDCIKKIIKARSRMILSYPFFGHLAIKLKVVEIRCGTAATDGTHLFVDPRFIAKLPDEEILGLVAHEVLHCGFKHMFRLEERDPETWNEACDYIINDQILEMGLKLPKGALVDKKYKGMFAEQVYTLLRREKQKKQGGGNYVKTKPQDAGEEIEGAGMGHCATGSILAPPKGADKGNQSTEEDDENLSEYGARPLTEGDWTEAMNTAVEIGKKAGRLPGDMQKQIDNAREFRPDCWDVLKQFVQATIPKDFTFRPPNRRHAYTGLYLQSVVKENTPRIACGVDTSGSMWYVPGMLELINAKCREIFNEYKPEMLHIVYCDTRVTAEEFFEPTDDFELHPKGGGGTYFGPVFNLVNDLDSDEKPACLIYFTDLENGGEQLEEPDYPVIWVTTEQNNYTPPFGTHVKIPDP